jgi:hypothetical protein
MVINLFKREMHPEEGRAETLFLSTEYEDVLCFQRNERILRRDCFSEYRSAKEFVFSKQVRVN